MELIIVESPYSGETHEQVEKHITYARRCMKHIISQGGCPFASHLLYTQKGILNDSKEAERKKGIQCGYAWGSQAVGVAFFMDYGMSTGMVAALEHYTWIREYYIKIDFSYIGENK